MRKSGSTFLPASRPILFVKILRTAGFAPHRIENARANALSHSHRGTDGERQIRPGAAAGAGDGRRPDQRRFDAGLSRSAHHHRATRRRGGGEGAASPVRPCRRRGQLFGRACGLRPRGRARRGGSARAALPIFVGGTGLYFKALTQGLSGIPSVPDEVRAAVRARGAGVPAGRASRRTRPPRSFDGRAPSAQRPAAHPARARSSGGDGPKPCRFPGRADAALAGDTSRFVRQTALETVSNLGVL